MDLKIDVVISAVGGGSLLDQLILVEAIQECGTVKIWNAIFGSDVLILLWRFAPSEVGHDVDRADSVEPGLTMCNEKRKVRRAVEVPESHVHTFVATPLRPGLTLTTVTLLMSCLR